MNIPKKQIRQNRCIKEKKQKAGNNGFYRKPNVRSHYLMKLFTNKPSNKVSDIAHNTASDTASITVRDTARNNASNTLLPLLKTTSTDKSTFVVNFDDDFDVDDFSPTVLDDKLLIKLLKDADIKKYTFTYINKIHLKDTGPFTNKLENALQSTVNKETLTLLKLILINAPNIVTIILLGDIPFIPGLIKLLKEKLIVTNINCFIFEI
jgi:hypothetical protein